MAEPTICLVENTVLAPILAAAPGMHFCCPYDGLAGLARIDGEGHFT